MTPFRTLYISLLPFNIISNNLPFKSAILNAQNNTHRQYKNLLFLVDNKHNSIDSAIATDIIRI